MDITIKELIAMGVLVVGLVGLIETRIRSKVNKDTCKATTDQYTTQLTRIESHIWDIMRAQNIKPSVEVPDGIKNNNR